MGQMQEGILLVFGFLLSYIDKIIVIRIAIFGNIR